MTSAKVVATTAQDEVIGYAYLADREQHIVYEVGGAVHPAYWGQGISGRLIDWAKQQARLLSTHAPAAVKTVLQANLHTAEREAIQLFTRRGSTKVREWLHLVIELQTPPQLPCLPTGWLLRPMDLDNDWELVGPAMDEAFADHWGAIALSLPVTEMEEPAIDADVAEDESYSNAPGFGFVLLDNDRAVGGVLCNARLVERDDTGRVGSLFVRPTYRRQGVGRAFMLEIHPGNEVRQLHLKAPTAK